MISIFIKIPDLHKSTESTEYVKSVFETYAVHKTFFLRFNEINKFRN